MYIAILFRTSNNKLTFLTQKLKVLHVEILVQFSLEKFICPYQNRNTSLKNWYIHHGFTSFFRLKHFVTNQIFYFSREIKTKMTFSKNSSKRTLSQ